MDELEDMLMEHGIMKPIDEAIVGKDRRRTGSEAALRESTASERRRTRSRRDTASQTGHRTSVLPRGETMSLTAPTR